MTDNDHVRAIRTAVLAVQDAETAIEPAHKVLNDAVNTAKEAGLKVGDTCDVVDHNLPTIQPRIWRETDY